VRIIDFGLTKSLRLHDAESGKWRREPAAYVGKIYYMAPEVFNNAPGDADVDLVGCDLWSLGVALFVLVAGQYPFRMPSHADADYALHCQAGATKLLRSMIKRGAITDLRVSEYFLDLLQLTLTPDPTSRITLQGMRAHPFLQEGN
jgi:serine/threonine protein kinase